MTSLPELFSIRAICFLVLGVLFLSFVVWYIKPAWDWWRRQKKIIQALEKIRNQGTPVTDIDHIGKDAGFSAHPALQHLWREFSHTLHAEKAVDADGQERVIRFRATVPAEAFFSHQALADNPLRTEFFKHLPGIFTGIGIIGTFLGLIQGLKGFHVTANPDVVRASLTNLMNSVEEAFTVSFSAIFLAMLCTGIEKCLYMLRVRQVDDLCGHIDALFESGAGEEYLARLVKSSESSATHAGQLRDSLVGDLKEILERISRQQIAAIDSAAQEQAKATETSGAMITKGVADELKGHLDRFVDRSTERQGDAVQNILCDLIVSFKQQIDSTFGGQIQNINEMIKGMTEQLPNLVNNLEKASATSSAAHERRQSELQEQMNSVLSGLQEKIGTLVTTVTSLSANLKNAGEGAADTLAQRLADAAEDLGRQLQDSQKEIGQMQEETLQSLKNDISFLVNQVKEQGEEAARGHGEREKEFREATEQAVRGISGKVEELMGRIANTMEEMNRAIAKLGETSLSAIGRMESAADSIAVAADDFAKAGNGMGGMLDQARTVSGELATTSGRLATSSADISKAAESYQGTAQRMLAMVEALRDTVENAKREASMTEELVDQLAAAAEALVTAEAEAEKYLDQVTEVLAASHRNFADNIMTTLGTGNAEFHRQLAGATNLLGGAIKELADTIDEIPRSE